VAGGFLWVVGSHGLKRKNAKPDRDHAENAKRLAKVALGGNRRLLACLPIEPDAKGEPCLVRQAQDGRRALRLKGDAQTNLLTSALADDRHFGPYMAIPGKDNGFDIEGLAVDGRRLLLGLRGPVLRHGPLDAPTWIHSVAKVGVLRRGISSNAEKFVFPDVAVTQVLLCPANHPAHTETSSTSLRPDHEDLLRSLRLEPSALAAAQHRAPTTSMELPAAAGDGGTPPACGAGVDPDPH